MPARPEIGDQVKWSNGRKPLGVVINKFMHKGTSYVVVEQPRGGLVVARVYEMLEVISQEPSNANG